MRGGGFLFSGATNCRQFLDMYRGISQDGLLNIPTYRFPFTHLVRECRWVFLFAVELPVRRAGNS
jgi:hypothetical protein